MYLHNNFKQVVGVLVDSLFPDVLFLAHYWKANEADNVKRHRQKNIQNKNSTNKIKFIYQEIHEKRNITNILI